MTRRPSLLRRALRRLRRAALGRRPGDPGRARPGRTASALAGEGTGPPLVPTAQVELAEQQGPPALVMLVPSLELDRLTGGPNTALQIGARVAARGVPVRFVATHGGVAPVEATLRAHLGLLIGGDGSSLPVSFESVQAPPRPLRVTGEDAVLATWWPTAHLAAAAIESSGAPHFLYLIQDFEPAFYPWSTNYALALATYSMPIRAVFNHPFLRDHFVAGGVGRFGTENAADIAIAFEPAVDTSVFRRRPLSGPRRLLFYARPSKPRNAYPLGLEALRRAVADGAIDDGWELWSMGEHVPETDLGRGMRLRPTPWRDLEGYAELLGTSDVLLSLMLSPHPSYPPLEMAASGGVVVTNSFGVKTAEALARISPRIRAVEPEVGALAAALAEAVAAPRDGPAPALGLPETWDASLQPVVDWILRVGFERGG